MKKVEGIFENNEMLEKYFRNLCGKLKGNLKGFGIKNNIDEGNKLSTIKEEIEEEDEEVGGEINEENEEAEGEIEEEDEEEISEVEEVNEGEIEEEIEKIVEDIKHLFVDWENEIKNEKEKLIELNPKFEEIFKPILEEFSQNIDEKAKEVLKNKFGIIKEEYPKIENFFKNAEIFDCFKDLIEKNKGQKKLKRFRVKYGVNL
uniref:Uncharacterized protein n=1 Tax=Meloidogyne enterolobii TaxID=390850 RepID=A0A6V7VRK3_MELEN|nr:unnamed protein product [Meloidogyne enterolobii]